MAVAQASSRVIALGAGGHAKVLIEILRAMDTGKLLVSSTLTQSCGKAGNDVPDDTVVVGVPSRPLRKVKA